ncbi:MAG: CinA family protein [Clostridia bacterium]|nr:CinA family protein [Clostridia bacterium]
MKKRSGSERSEVVNIEHNCQLSEETVNVLRRSGWKLATVESCTGGLISKLITDIPGSSDVFELGITTYSNEMKTRMVGVPEEVLAHYGAVSEQTATAMAKGLLALSGADIAVSVTGIAGPGGGTAEKPVGLIFLGFAVRGCEKVDVMKLEDDGAHRSRADNRCHAAQTALRGILERATAYQDGLTGKE